VEVADLILRIQGRIDGVLATPGQVLLEEIKTVQGHWDGAADPLHWAQAKCYGYIYAYDHCLPELLIQLTYLNVNTGKLTDFRERFSYGELSGFFSRTTAPYIEWLRERHCWCQQRDSSINSLNFPFPRYRPGQRDLAVAVYRTLARGGRLFIEAPTGIGKTVAVLYPALKALASAKLERIFYLTARTVGRTVVEKALDELRQTGLRLRTVTLTAKEKLCVRRGEPCDSSLCPLATGYYDRRHAAMRDGLAREAITRPVLEALAQHHQVCPFELSLDLSFWSDALVCDYNYLFDPQVCLRRHFTESAREYGFLVDEAHNLVDRAREMFSAELDSREIDHVRLLIKQSVPHCAKAFSRLSLAIRKLSSQNAEPPEQTIKPETEPTLFAPVAPVSCEDHSRNGASQRPSNIEGPAMARRELPSQLPHLLREALAEAETWLMQNQPAEFRESLLQLYFRLHSFLRTAEQYDESYVTILERRISTRIRLFCLDPSFLLRKALDHGKAAVFFSATLTPAEYYRSLLGGSPDDPLLKLDSPFPPENLAVLVHDRIRTELKARTKTVADVANAIDALVRSRPGNYLVYLPSYQYLETIREQLLALRPDTPVLTQRPGMTEPEREAFLAAFTATSGKAQVGFAVMGGIFGEGIDLVGERLIGAVIVGVGLPQVSIERELVRDYFGSKTGQGYEYAYLFPGMNRVLQATGRVIRSETDRGLVLLIDTRFAQKRYLGLFPAWWRPVRVRSTREIEAAVQKFWQP
jgi:DNA excision repair protein ERCC-2